MIQCLECSNTFPEPPAWPIHCPCGAKIQARGLGDTVATVLHKAGVRKKKGCGCQKRQAALNRVVPYRAQKNA